MVECQLPKLDVAGSTPVTRSILTEALAVLRCPTCEKKIEDEASKYAPFCSERCKLIDLGRWFDGEFRVPGEPADASEGPDEGEDERER